jgi:Xaa-Pro aminopeptidase
MVDGGVSVSIGMKFRHDRIVQALERSQFDALIAASPENVLYLSGAYNPIRKILPERPAMVLWPRDGSPVLIAAAIEEVFLRKQSTISDLTLYQGATEAAVSVLADALKKRRLSATRLGVDLEGVSAHFFRELIQRVPEAEFEDCSGLFLELRAIKSDEEVQALSHAAQATDCAEWKALDAFQTGWTETKLGFQLRQALLSEGADTIAFLILGGGVRGVAAHALPSDTPLAQGELVRFDMGGFFAGWASDLAKTACVGEPSSRQRQVYRTLRNILDDHIARIQPGRTAGDLFEAVVSDFQRANLNFSAPHVGHGIGLSVHEQPILSAGNPTAIRSGMVICAELIYVEQELERYHLEELVFVRDRETEVVSRSRPKQEEIPTIG